MNTNYEPKRLLCIVSSMNTGGAETFLMKVYCALDKTKYQMDFYCMSQEEGFYEKEIKSLGGKIYHSMPKSINFIKSFITLKDTVKENNYDYVIRVSQHSLATLDLVAAKIGGAKTLVQRSSNADSNSRVDRLLHSLFKWLPMTIPTMKIAPSTEAAEYTFGKKCIDNGKAKIIKNGILMENFIFNQERRGKIRKELNINGEFAIGHVGRFNNQKNHRFLIDIFDEVVKKNEKSVLILVGKGELEYEIRKKIENLGLIDKVIFTGVRSDIPDLMMAMDVFVFPSFFEGMPNTVIEAQATGLPCIISDKITKEANITGIVEYLSLDEIAETWAEKVVYYSIGYERKDMHSVFAKNGYDINNIVREIEEMIFNCNNR